MEFGKQSPVARVLTDEDGRYYDIGDMFETEQLGQQWARSWVCSSNRSLQVGDVVFFLTGDFSQSGATEWVLGSGICARGSLIAGEGYEQLRLRDSDRFGDLSAAYYIDSGMYEDLVGQEEYPFEVRFILDSIVDMEHSLSLTWLREQPGCQGLFPEVPPSGEIIPAHFVAFLHEYWDTHVSKLEAEELGARLRPR